MDNHGFFLELAEILVSARRFAAIAVKGGARTVVGELAAALHGDGIRICGSL